MDTTDKRLKRIWYGMRDRCSPNTKNPSGKLYYYDKGIRVCEEWQNSFPEFREWALQNGYENHLTIDRIDPDGNYEPSNCRWITLAENSRRAKRKPFLEHRSEVGKFMVIKRIQDGYINQYRFNRYQVIQTGLYKNEALKIAEELNSKQPKWDSYRYIAGVTNNCKVGQKIVWEQTGCFLKDTKVKKKTKDKQKPERRQNMSEMEMKERLEKLSQEIDPMPSEQKSFILGFMEGVAQMSDRNRNKEEE